MGFSFRRLIYRSWFYFRAGYGTYVSLPLGVASNLVVLYELAVVKNKYLSPVFQSLTIFTVAALLVFVPIAIFLGLFHVKRTGAFSADAALQTEANPYIYKAIGKDKEVLYPLLALTAKGLAKVLEQQRILTPEEKREFEEVVSKANLLVQGKPIGLPRRSGLLARSTGEGQS